MKGKNRYFFLFAFPFLLFLSGCGATYPEEKLEESIVDLCQKDFGVSVTTKIAGNTVAVRFSTENLFDGMFNLNPEASRKINDVIMAVSRIVLSTDAELDFYIIFAQDPEIPDLEIVYIRYVKDVKRFMYGGMSRDDYTKRAIIAIKTPPQAERERILRELFAKLDIEKTDEMVDEYAQQEEEASGIGEISYWNNKFFIKDIGIEEFLAIQIADRIRIEFKNDNEINRWYELKTSNGNFIKGWDTGSFIFNTGISDRVTPLYLDSGLELGARKKRSIVFKKLFSVVSDVLWAYKFQGFNEVEFVLPTESVVVSRENLWAFRRRKVKIEDLI